MCRVAATLTRVPAPSVRINRWFNGEVDRTVRAAAVRSPSVGRTQRESPRRRGLLRRRGRSPDNDADGDADDESQMAEGQKGRAERYANDITSPCEGIPDERRVPSCLGRDDANGPFGSRRVVAWAVPHGVGGIAHRFEAGFTKEM